MTTQHYLTDWVRVVEETRRRQEAAIHEFPEHVRDYFRRRIYEGSIRDFDELDEAIRQVRENGA